jgi:pyruvate dehydrogenase E2 component (dihydrolipoyllysine-residue acetyltransferase)
MDVRLPKLGEGAESGTVVGIMVREGDTITEGQTILELENEKAIASIPSTASGKITSLRVKEGDKLSVGQVILTVAEEGRNPARTVSPSASAPAPHREEEVPAGAPLEAPAEARSEEAFVASSGEPPAASPSIRKMARDLGIDLRRVRGSERGGRIVLADVRAYIERLQKIAFETRSGAPARPQAAAAERIDFSKWGPVHTQPLSPLRKVISQRMLESWSTIPHVTQFDKADITALSELRKKHAPAFEKKGARLTLTSFILKALAGLLKKHSIFNASLDTASEQIVFKDYFHIGVAVDTEQGLIVPVIRDVDKKDLFQLSVALGELAEKARSRKVSLEELKGGTFTISNQGGIGSRAFTPIINKPEVAILGLGRGVQEPLAREGRFEARWMLPLALSYDHRVIDGASAARFMVDLVQALENFPEADLK